MERDRRDFADWHWLIQYKIRQAPAPPVLRFWTCRSWSRTDAIRKFAEFRRQNNIQHIFQAICFNWYRTQPTFNKDGYPTNTPEHERMTHAYTDPE